METRALAAALGAPAFATRGAGAAMHAADRHMERWAPESRASRVRPLRTLGFVDRLVTPWLDTARRSIGMRLLGQTGAERESPHVSWVFPRPWYLDELSWMAAARQPRPSGDAALLTTRGTYVTPGAAALPAALYEYVAPSLAVPTLLPEQARGEAFAPTVPLAALHAAQVMERVVAPMQAGATPQLRSVLATMLARSSMMSPEPTRKALEAPELVTPPAPSAPSAPSATDELIEEYAEQRQRASELLRIAQAHARVEAAAPVAATVQPEAPRPALRIAGGQLHEQARREAALDAARAAMPAAVTSKAVPAPGALPPELRTVLAGAVQQAREPAMQLPAELAAAVAREPARAMQALAELEQSLRTVELLARGAAAGGGFEATRGPRMLLPAGLGALSVALSPPSAPGTPVATPMHPALAAIAARAPAGLGHVAWADRWLARFGGASQGALDTFVAGTSPSEALRTSALAAAAPSNVFVAPVLDTARAAAPPRLDEIGAPISARQPGITPAPVPSYLIAQRVAALAPLARAPEQPAPVRRFDDDAETPDDVFAAIAAGAASVRAASSAKPAAAPVTAPAAEAPAAMRASSPVDAIARDVPVVPGGAGFSAQLAASPFAATLRHVLALPAASRFDVRALLGGELATTYLAGLLAPAETAARAASWDAAYVVPHQTAEAPAPSSSLDAPLLGETRAPAAAGELFAPGMVATRAHGWSVAQERSSADLAYDFVTPELVLAARVYGLGPAEAAQASRLAIGGPGQLTAMASAVDGAFVQALTADAERREHHQPRELPAVIATAFPGSAPDEITAVATTRRPAAADSTATATGVAQSPIPSGTAFGVARRVPRGAYLWPPGAVHALGLAAPGPDSELSMSVAALELIAAHSVIEIGSRAAAGAAATTSAAAAGMSPAAPAGVAGQADPHDEPAVIATMSALVPAERRARFDALYVALGRSPGATAWSPAARAARALALAGRAGEDEAPLSARERALAAWDVLPVVHGGAIEDSKTAAFELDARPGLAALSARAGEALGSYVAPPPPAQESTVQSSMPSPGSRGAVLRVPTAAQEFVQPGRPAGRHGGGETEIPPWFEAAARRMLEERGAGAADGISLAELTLVSAAPAAHVAASSRTAPAAAPAAPSATQAAAAGGKAEAVDVEKLANDVYREILVMMDVARARNGEPYL